MKIVDILFHVHPDLSDEQRSHIEDTVAEYNGVMHAQFNKQLPHELNVSYDPDAVKSEALLKLIRDWDKDARMVGL